MLWIVGPRQVGKTWLTRQLDAAYFNWDTPEVRRDYAKDPYFFRTEASLVIFDEIHKRRDWKKILKGYYDSPTRRENIIVTGSGRMDQYKKGGDSLQGRYNLCHLLPLTPDEIHASSPQFKPAKPREFVKWQPEKAPSDAALLRLGGFPAPFLKGSTTSLRRWQDLYLDRLIREDSRDFAAVQRLDQLDLLARLLPDRSGSPVSVLSLARDIEASPVGVKSWLRLFETLYLGFQMRPYHRKIHRAVKKESKWYFYQWTFVEDEPARFENYLAVQLQTACHAWSEQGYGRWETYYLRDQDRREVDFLICKDLKPIALIEAKLSFQPWPAGLTHYCRQLNVPGFLVYQSNANDQTRRNADLGWTLPSSRFLKGLILEQD